MPRPKGTFKAVPAYRHHKPSGRAVVAFGGKDHYVGRYGTKASRDAYDRLVGEWLAGGRADAAAPTHGITVVEVIAAFWRHAQTYCRKPDGSPSSEVKNFRDALCPPKRLYGATAAAAFGPLSLRALRDEMIRLGWSRTYINRQVNRVRHVFKWAASRELLPSSAYYALQAVEGLKAGRSNARESVPVTPVDEAHVRTVLPYLSPPVKAMVEQQLLTGMRPGEVIRMRTCDVDTTGDLWMYTPASHKTQHHGHARQTILGPRSKEIVGPMLKPDLKAFLFSPADASRLKNCGVRST